MPIQQNHRHTATVDPDLVAALWVIKGSLIKAGKFLTTQNIMSAFSGKPFSYGGLSNLARRSPLYHKILVNHEGETRIEPTIEEFEYCEKYVREHLPIERHRNAAIRGIILDAEGNVMAVNEFVLQDGEQV